MAIINDPRETFPHLASCANCSMDLTYTNIVLALEDAPHDMDDVTLCCPSYDGNSCSEEFNDNNPAYLITGA